MKDQVKITKTEDFQGEHLVCRGKLVLIPINKEPSNVILSKMIGTDNIYRGFDSGFKNKKYYSQVVPIIISETENIKVGDKYYDKLNPTIWTSAIDTKIKGHYKVLVLPEHFSSKQLKAICNGKLKDGDVVYVECYYRWYYLRIVKKLIVQLWNII